MQNSKFKKLDKSLFKGKDLGLLNQVISYLKKFDLNVELRGSAQKNAYLGSPRNYRDIDLLVKSEPQLNDNYCFNKYNAIMGLARAYAGQNNEYGPSFEDKITNYSQKGQLYVDTRIENRFTIQTKDPKTIIDLCFEAD